MQLAPVKRPLHRAMPEENAISRELSSPRRGALRSTGAATLPGPAQGARAIVAQWATRLENEAKNGTVAVTIAGNADGKGRGTLSLSTTAADGTTVRKYLEALASFPIGKHLIEATELQRLRVAFISDAEWSKFQDLYQARTGLRPPDEEPGYNALTEREDGTKELTLMVREQQTREPATMLREGIYGVLLEKLLVRGTLIDAAIDREVTANYTRLTEGQPEAIAAKDVTDATALRGLWKKNAAGDGFEKMPLGLYRELTARLLGNLIARQLLAAGRDQGMDVRQYATALFHPDPAKTFSVIASPDERHASYTQLARKLLEIDYADLLYYGGILEIAAPPHLGFFGAEQQVEAEAWVSANYPAAKLAARLAESIPAELDRRLTREIRRIAGA